MTAIKIDYKNKWTADPSDVDFYRLKWTADEKWREITRAHNEIFYNFYIDDSKVPEKLRLAVFETCMLFLKDSCIQRYPWLLYGLEVDDTYFTVTYRRCDYVERHRYNLHSDIVHVESGLVGKEI